MRRLHVQFYLAILATLAVFLLATAVLWHLTGRWRGDAWGMTATTQLAEGLLPPKQAPPAEQQKTLADLHHRLHMDLALYDMHGALLAVAGNLPHLSERRLNDSGRALSRAGPVWIFPLEDGRRLVVRPRRGSDQRAGWRVFIVPLSIVIAFALGAYPIARKLTRRLERLQTGVEQLGQGNLNTRIAVEGRDEVAALARSFNHSAGRIEELVKSHKLLLANCSHELRTPLARIRLGLERLVQGSDGAVREEIARSIAELDALIGEMLLASRLDALQTLEHVEDIDLLALAAEEAAHFDRSVEGFPVIIRGDPNLLRRLLRNLLDNAQRHADGATRIHVSAKTSTEAELIVEDRGTGIAGNEQEKIFEPFYRSGRAQTSERGFGLGLALVRQIARAHGGDVQYSALLKGGSRFTVILANRPRTER